VTGVRWYSPTNRWVVQVGGGKGKYVGYFKDLTEAIIAKVVAMEARYGEFAPT
jgi:hypothetical protein